MESAGSGRVIHLDPPLACSGPDCVRSAHIAIVEPDPVERGVWRLCPLCSECAYLIAIAAAPATEHHGHQVIPT